MVTVMLRAFPLGPSRSPPQRIAPGSTTRGLKGPLAPWRQRGRQRDLAVRASGDLAGDVGRKLMGLALKEPVAFLGGVFAGLLSLDLKEDPLKSWVERTSAQAGVRGASTASTKLSNPGGESVSGTAPASRSGAPSPLRSRRRARG